MPSGRRSSPRAVSLSPEPTGMPSSGGSAGGAGRGRGRPRRQQGVTPSSSPTSAGSGSTRRTRSSSASSSASGNKRERPERLAAAGGDDATCNSRDHPRHLKCAGCLSNLDKALNPRAKKLEPCEQLWKRKNCGNYYYKLQTHLELVEWERGKMRLPLPDLVQTKEDKKKMDETASPIKKCGKIAPKKKPMDEEPSPVAAAAAATAAAFEPTATLPPRQTACPPPLISISPPQPPPATPSPSPSPSPSSSPCPGMYVLTPRSSDKDIVRHMPYCIRAMKQTADALAEKVKDMLNGATEAIRKAGCEYVRAYIAKGDMLMPINNCVMDLSPGSLIYRSLGCVRGAMDGMLSRCISCANDISTGRTRKASGRAANFIPIPVPRTTPIRWILEYLDTGRDAIESARKMARAERTMRLRAEHQLRLLSVGRIARGRTATAIMGAMEEANRVIGDHYADGTDERELWEIHYHHMTRVMMRGGKTRGIRYEKPILDLAIVLLASTSHSVYKRLQKIFKLPDHSYVCRLTAKKVTKKGTKLRNIHTVTLSSMNQHFKDQGMKRGHSARIGKLSVDAVNVNSTLEFDKKSNLILGMDQTMSVSVVKQQFESLVRGASENDEADAAATTAATAATTATTTTATTATAEAEAAGDEFDFGEEASIIDNLRLADQHLCLRWTSLDPDVEISEVVATIDVSKMTPEVVAAVSIEAMDIMASVYGIHTCSSFADDAGENAKFAATFSSLEAKQLISEALVKEYEGKGVDLSVKVGFKDLTTGNLVTLVPDMPHLTKNLVTAMEYSSKMSQKRDLRRGTKGPVNLNMIKIPWVKTGGRSKQQNPTKLTVAHFEKNSYSRMKVYLAMQVLSNSVKTMLEKVCANNRIDVGLDRSHYVHLIEFVDNWNKLVDNCNGRDGENYTPANGRAKQRELLDILAWFTAWKKEHDADVAAGKATEYNFFAPTTWKCIQRLILGFVALIEDMCIKRGLSVVPRRLNTDDLEQHFGECRQFVGGSTDKLTSKGWSAAHGKASAKKMGTQYGNNSAAPIFIRMQL